MSEKPKYWEKIWVRDIAYAGPEQRKFRVQREIFSCKIFRDTESKIKWNHMRSGSIDENVLTECVHMGSIDKGVYPDCASCPVYKKAILGVDSKGWFRTGLKRLKRENRAVITTADYDPKKPTIVQMRRDRGKK